MPPAIPMLTTNKLFVGPASNPDGKDYGGSATDPIGFFGALPIAQPTNPMQTAIPQGASGFANAGGAVVIYTSSQTPSLITANTVAEQSITVTGVLSTDLVIVNKPTSQAGIAVCQPRVSAANTVKLVFGNVTAGSLTPTGSESYLVMTFAANLQITATLTPALVAANAVNEQTFVMTGTALGALAPGMIVAVNKPTTQAGLGVMYARVSANNTLAICFANFTAATLTPTAAEAYIITGMNGVMPVSSVINFGINDGTLALVATITATEQSVTEAGIQATDVLIGITKPTQQVGLGLLSGRVSAASTVKVSFVNPTAGSLTPTGSEVLGVTVYRPSPGSLVSLFTVSIAPASVAANTSAEQTFAVTGITSGQPVYGCPNGNATTAGACVPAGIRASATNQIAINFVNLTAAAIVPPTLNWTIAQFNQTTPTAGNFVALQVTPFQTTVANMLSAIRAAAVSMGLILGS